jgi:DNA-binding transcriptional ArsR family regulator
MTETSFRAARLHKVLGNPLRYRILLELYHAPCTPGQLARRVHRPLPAVSRALTILHGVDLVAYRTVGAAPVYFPKHDEFFAYLVDGEGHVRRFSALDPQPDAIPASPGGDDPSR